MQYRLGLYEKAMPDALPLEEKLAAARRAGFDFMEISIDETDARQQRLYWDDVQRGALRRAMEHTGMPIDTMCLSGHRKWPLGSHDQATRERGSVMFRRAVDLAHDLGIRIVQLAGYDVYYEPGDNDTRAWFEQGLRHGIAYAAQHGVLCGFETMETPFMDTVSKAMAYVDAVHSPYLGVYPDLGNLTNACRLYDMPVEAELARAQGRLLAMHLKETLPGQYRDLRFGVGHVDFVSGIEKAWALGVRCFVAECWHDGRPNWESGLREAGRFLRDRFAQAGACD